jgi:hypothetical protein
MPLCFPFFFNALKWADMFDDGNIYCKPVIDLSDMEGGGDTPVE